MRIIAHRGFSEAYPENTLLAFEKAIEAGADGIETDIRLAEDGIPVIAHDSRLSRISHPEMEVEMTPSVELVALDASSWFDPALPVQHLPTLQTLLETINGRCQMILELKSHPDTCRIIASAVEAQISDKLAWCEVSSFDDTILEDMYALNPAVRLHKLIEDPSELEADDFDKRYSFVAAFDILIDLQHHPRVQTLLQGEIPVIFWVVNEEEIIGGSALEGVMSNNPHKARLIYNG